MLEKLRQALERRASLREHTDALRIVDGRGDGFEDLEIDDFAGHWLVQTRSGVFPEWLREAREAKAIYWKRLGEKIAPARICGSQLEAPFLIKENGVQFEIDFQCGYSQGLFLDQRDNRRTLRELARGKSVLNCFAYTCGFGLCAALGGGTTVNVDLSKRYLEWGRRNYASNDVDPAGHEFFTGDVSRQLARMARQGRSFDVVVVDPPTFSRDERGRVFKIEEGLPTLVVAAAKVLAPAGALFCSTNRRSLSSADFKKLIGEGLGGWRGWEFARAPMPADFRGDPYLKAAWVRRG